VGWAVSLHEATPVGSHLSTDPTGVFAAFHSNQQVQKTTISFNTAFYLGIILVFGYFFSLSMVLQSPLGPIGYLIPSSQCFSVTNKLYWLPIFLFPQLFSHQYALMVTKFSLPSVLKSPIYLNFSHCCFKCNNFNYDFSSILSNPPPLFY
jgi:hypothetical protein